MPKYTTYSEIVSVTDQPAVAINEHGVFELVNQAFTDTFGWSATELLGKPITIIIPPHMRDAHTVGFSRFMTTEKPTILDQPLPLPVYAKGGQIIDATHHIVGEKYHGKWRFAATITLPADG